MTSIVFANFKYAIWHRLHAFFSKFGTQPDKDTKLKDQQDIARAHFVVFFSQISGIVIMPVTLYEQVVHYVLTVLSTPAFTLDEDLIELQVLRESAVTICDYLILADKITTYLHKKAWDEDASTFEESRFLHPLVGKTLFNALRIHDFNSIRHWPIHTIDVVALNKTLNMRKKEKYDIAYAGVEPVKLTDYFHH